MRRLLLALFLAAPGLALAQASASVRIDLPVVLPQLVVVSPGIRVVPDVDYEVFYVNGWYWTRSDGGWYRSRDHRGGWAYAEPRFVPPGLVRIPPGQYRHYRQAQFHEMKREEHERRHEEHEREKEQRRAEKEQWKGWKKGHKGGHGHDDD